jgi:hypothetical protein
MHFFLCWSWPTMLLVQSMINTVYCIGIRIQLFRICWSWLTILFGNHNNMIWHPYVRQIGKEKESQEREETLVSFSSLEDIPKKEDFRKSRVSPEGAWYAPGFYLVTFASGFGLRLVGLTSYPTRHQDVLYNQTMRLERKFYGYNVCVVPVPGTYTNHHTIDIQNKVRE